MTLVTAWTRATQNNESELWIMSDSRLSGGKFWDYGPKIFGIGRSDALIAFAGDTAWTYPLISQISSYVESFVNLRDRVIDIIDAHDLILTMLNDSLKFISKPYDDSLRIPECSFIFAGYSARRKYFFIRRIVFNKKNHRFESRPSQKVAGEQIILIGDKDPVRATVRYIHENKNTEYRGRLGMIPAKGFLKTLLSKRYTEIGGAPQVAKIYQHMSQRHFGVYWPPDIPHEDQRIYLRGRRLNPFDVLDHQWLFDPETNRLFWHDFSPGNETQKNASRLIHMRKKFFIQQV